MATAAQRGVSSDVRDNPSAGSTLFDPVRRDASLSWWAEPDEAEELDSPEASPKTLCPQTLHRFALLLDIGLAEASVVVDDLPEDDQVLWFELAGGRAEAEIVEATFTARGPHLLRIAFRDECPFAILKRAIRG